MTTRDLFSFSDREGAPNIPERVVKVTCRTALSPSRLPGLDYSLNPYEGCEHGCVYCYAPYVLRREPSAWGSWVKARANLPGLLARELGRAPGVIGLGTVTDPYQPVEAEMRLTERCLREIAGRDAPLSVLTKSDLVVRDAGLISRLSRGEVGITITTSVDDLASALEPRAPCPSRRIAALRRLNSEGVETYALIGPMIPGVTDRSLEDLLAGIAAVGTRRIMLDRLRLRPGMAERIRSLPLLSDSEIRERFEKGIASTAYAAALEARIRDLAKAEGLSVASAF